MQCSCPQPYTLYPTPYTLRHAPYAMHILDILESRWKLSTFHENFQPWLKSTKKNVFLGSAFSPLIPNLRPRTVISA